MALRSADEHLFKCKNSFTRAESVLELNLLLQREKRLQVENELKARNHQNERYVERV